MSVLYAHTLEYSVSFDSETRKIKVENDSFGELALLSLGGFMIGGLIPGAFSDFEYLSLENAALVKAYFLVGNSRIALFLESNPHGVRIYAEDEAGKAVELDLSGKVGAYRDAINDAFATRIGREGGGLRAAVGPAALHGDNVIFDRTRDIATVMSNEPFGKCADGLALTFDFCENAYTASFVGEVLCISAKSGVHNEIYGMHYGAINKSSTFRTPPMGWMTWYSVKFDASEWVILENAKIMKEKLSPYGADTVWVDWEWQHEVFNTEGPSEVDVFNPFKDRYPNGLAYLAGEISKMGLTPALWVAFTHEPGRTKFISEHPECVIDDEICWYGRYTFDPSHPVWRNEYLIPAAKRVPEMGYRAIKWDCLPRALTVCDNHSDQMYSKISPNRAMREAVEIVRDTLGRDFYMMSCSGDNDRSVLFGADMFDGARVGLDVFEWEAFEETANRLCHLYSIHNTLLYCDPDNVVVRDEFNKSELEKQARISLVSLLGLPITIGDDLRTLPDRDVEYYKRGLPSLDAHPMDIRDFRMQDRLLTVNLAVSKPHSTWNTVGVFNFNSEERTLSLDLSKDLFLSGEKYHVFDFWRGEYLGTVHDKITLTLVAHECRVLRFTPYSDVPTVISTSRHLSCGVPDLIDISYDGACLRGRSAVVSGDEYTVYIFDPKKESVGKVIITPTESGEVEWEYNG